MCNCNRCIKHHESCTDQKDPVAASGCNGIGIFNAWVQLKAHIDLMRGWQDLRWKQHNVLNKSLEGSCKDFLHKIQHFQVSPVVEKIQERLQKSWGNMQAKRRLTLGHAAQVSLHFLRPKITSLDAVHAIKGSIMACMHAGGFRYYVAHPNETCKERLAKQVSRVTNTRRITEDLSILAAGKKDITSLVFSWQGSSKVEVSLLGFETVYTVKLERNAFMVEATLTVKLQNALCEFFGGPGACKNDGKKAFPQKYWSSRLYFWLSFDTASALFSFGEGMTPGQSERKRIGILNSGLLKEPDRFSLSSFGQATSWTLSSGGQVRVCSSSSKLPTVLVHKDHGAVRFSISLLEGLYWASAQQFQEAVQVSNSTKVRDAHLHDILHIGSIRLDESTPDGSGGMRLMITGSNTTSWCRGRAKPLLQASVQEVRGRVRVEGKRTSESLRIAAVFDAAPLQVSGFVLESPSVPLSPAATKTHANYVVSQMLPSINRQLEEHYALTIPDVFARYIPCKMASGRCQNLVVQTTDLEQGGYMEFAEVEKRASVQFLVAQDMCGLIYPAYSSLAKWFNCGCHADTLHTLAIFSSALLGFLLITFVDGSKICSVSWLMLFALSLSWCRDGPFNRFVASALWGLSGKYGTDAVEEMLQSWNNVAFSFTLMELLAVLFWTLVNRFLLWTRARLAVKLLSWRKLVYMCFSGFVCLSQFGFLFGLPMMTFLGRRLSESGAAQPCKDAMLLLSAQSNSTLAHPQATALSCTFTAMYVSHLGLYLVFFLLAMPPGMFLGIMSFFTAKWSERQKNRAADLATLWLLITELVSFASVLGALLSVYQIVGGTMQWWAACCICGVCRPFFAVPSCMLLSRSAEVRRPSFLLVSLGLGYLGFSLTGAVILFRAVALSLQSLSTAGQHATRSLSWTFICAMYGNTLWFVASSLYLALEDAVCHDCLHVRRVRNWVEDQASRRLIKDLKEHEMAGAAEAAHFLGPETWKVAWQSVLPWIIWMLEMDALVSLLYHVVKMVRIGWAAREVQGVFSRSSRMVLKILHDLDILAP